MYEAKRQPSNPPEKGSFWYEKILSRGCGGFYDYWGDFDCRWSYRWECEYCPIALENPQQEDEEGEPYEIL